MAHWILVYERTMNWLLVIGPGIPYVFLYMGYKRTLQFKRNSLERLMMQHESFKEYVYRYGAAGATGKDVIDTIFDLTYNWKTYVLAVVFNILAIVAAMAVVLVRANRLLGLPPGLEGLMADAPRTFSAGVAGAYVLNMYEVLRRYRTGDLFPASLHFNWLHLVLASIVAPFFCVAAKVPFSVAGLVAFGVGAFPIRDTISATREFAAKRMSMVRSQIPSERPSLHNLQGLTEEIIERLEEEGIASTEHLAYADPVKLLLRTNIEWIVIIDLIDQALLFNYMESDITKLRPAGIRGSIEMAMIGSRLYEATATDENREWAKTQVSIIAGLLGQKQEEVLGLIRTMYEDSQVQLIWSLFGGSYEEHSMDGGEEMLVI
jgi:hypothetical protein